ncbi:hypothetical protein PHYBLDRAFT_138117 [Phycomyces blakesleeanus NRRL 1555(-)]|uniref:Uncharacterized protein n=1 Tax=Phycomyces blakesleeanus (strain ATCC 8743b / DSM 1359 / FGSC 10004 / NBRC 33097 / NRRL 1555) TaxID=763407 RepID=A0A167R0F2_PHYB8|nr:hypothetical protein PHYBLDRAFT_138117 [Phycomyces blakesleeanus NRRL 1555(-)]OAD80558.1 hypothetical protein PHYBLDRAFT_138117 [Phycomyces blakesleeanus NRRL 1555(-)]|eukprot:XP_018298598.1 hypothetical protein PHYBLDRAFT_138117 [Phycomyces blakesleeanus NRRL 1555(-)]
MSPPTLSVNLYAISSRFRCTPARSPIYLPIGNLMESLTGQPGQPERMQRHS